MWVIVPMIRLNVFIESLSLKNYNRNWNLLLFFSCVPVVNTSSQLEHFLFFGATIKGDDVYHILEQQPHLCSLNHEN